MFSSTAAMKDYSCIKLFRSVHTRTTPQSNHVACSASACGGEAPRPPPQPPSSFSLRSLASFAGPARHASRKSKQVPMLYPKFACWCWCCHGRARRWCFCCLGCHFYMPLLGCYGVRFPCWMPWFCVRLMVGCYLWVPWFVGGCCWEPQWCAISGRQLVGLHSNGKHACQYHSWHCAVVR